jgi:hypothetical protein
VLAREPVSVRTGMMEVPRKGSEGVRRKDFEGSVTALLSYGSVSASQVASTRSSKTNSRAAKRMGRPGYIYLPLLADIPYVLYTTG